MTDCHMTLLVNEIVSVFTLHGKIKSFFTLQNTESHRFLIHVSYIQLSQTPDEKQQRINVTQQRLMF